MWKPCEFFTWFSHSFSHRISQKCENSCEINMWKPCETGSAFSQRISQYRMWNTMWKGMWNVCHKAGKLPCENKCENNNYVKYHVKWDVKSYSHGKGGGNHPVKMDVKTIIMWNAMWNGMWNLSHMVKEKVIILKMDVKTITQTTKYNFFLLMLYEKVMVSAWARVKTIKYCSFCTAKVSNSVIARVRTSRSHFQSNLYSFHWNLDFVPNSESP